MSEPAPWTTLFARVKAALPGATDAMIKAEIAAVMIDFTQDTNLWTEVIPFSITPGTLDYVLPMNNGGFPNRLILVADPMVSPPRWFQDGISMPVPGTIHFTYDPSQAYDLVAYIAKSASTPAMDTSTPPKPTGYPAVDDWIPLKYVDVLYYGVIAYLQALPAKTFSNPQYSASNSLRYHSGKSMARVDGQKANIFGGQAWQYPQGWAAISRKGWA